MAKENDDSGTANDDDGYQVGYCHPPRHSRFKPGQSGNPAGRRRAERPETVRAALAQIFLEKISIREGDKRRRVRTIDALTRKLVTDAFKGDSKAAWAAYKLAFEFGVLNFSLKTFEPDFSELTKDEREKMFEAAVIIDRLRVKNGFR